MMGRLSTCERAVVAAGRRGMSTGVATTSGSSATIAVQEAVPQRIEADTATKFRQSELVYQQRSHWRAAGRLRPEKETSARPFKASIRWTAVLAEYASRVLASTGSASDIPGVSTAILLFGFRLF